MKHYPKRASNVNCNYYKPWYIQNKGTLSGECTTEQAQEYIEGQTIIQKEQNTWPKQKKGRDIFLTLWDRKLQLQSYGKKPKHKCRTVGRAGSKQHKPYKTHKRIQRNYKQCNCQKPTSIAAKFPGAY